MITIRDDSKNSRESHLVYGILHITRVHRQVKHVIINYLLNTEFHIMTRILEYFAGKKYILLGASVASSRFSHLHCWSLIRISWHICLILKLPAIGTNYSCLSFDLARPINVHSRLVISINVTNLYQLDKT